MILSISVFHFIGGMIITGIICLIIGYKVAKSNDAAKIDKAISDVKDKL